MTRQVRLGDTEVIQAILGRLDNLNARVGTVETSPPRGIAGAAVNSLGHLIITYTDGSTGDAGYIGSGTPPPAPTLGALTLSGPLQIGTTTSGTITGATAGSTIAGNIPGITVSSGARTYSGTPTGSAATIANGLVETLAGATGSPNPSPITVAAASTGNTFSVDNAPVTRSGNVFTFLARRAGNLSNAETHQYNVAGSTNYPPAANASDIPGSVTASFAAGSATAPLQVTSATAIPE